MSVVIAIIISLAALVVANMDGVVDDAGKRVAQANLNTIRDAFCGSAAGPGYIADMKYLPGYGGTKIPVSGNPPWRDVRVHDLLVEDSQPAFDPAAQRGWRGPYVRNGVVQGPSGDLSLADPWGKSIVLQVPPPEAFAAPSEAKRWRYARLVSTGPDGELKTPLDRLAGMQLLPDGTSKADRGDDLVLFLNRADVYEDEEP